MTDKTRDAADLRDAAEIAAEVVARWGFANEFAECKDYGELREAIASALLARDAEHAARMHALAADLRAVRGYLRGFGGMSNQQGQDKLTAAIDALSSAQSPAPDGGYPTPDEWSKAMAAPAAKCDGCRLGWGWSTQWPGVHVDPPDEDHPGTLIRCTAKEPPRG